MPGRGGLMKPKSFCILFSLLLLFCLTNSFVYSQRLTGILRGTVTDEQGELLPGVTVEIESPALIGGKKAMVTSPSGVFVFASLSPGSYTATFTLSGFQGIKREKIVVSVGKTISLDVAIKQAGIEETVNVIGAAPVVDVTKSGTSTTYDQQLLENIPKTRFTYMDIMFWAPGISMNETSSEEWHTSLGSAGWSDNYLVDGVDTSFDWNGTTWVWNNPDIYQEGEIVAVGAPAEYGDFQGAVVNVVTKSGGNDFHSALNIYSTPSRLVGNNVPGAEYPYKVGKNWDLGFDLSGPIKKDKIWFYGNAQWKRYEYSQLGTPADFPSGADYKRFFIKSTIQLSKNHKLVLSYQHEWSKLPDVITPSTPYDAAWEEPGNYLVPNIMLTSILGPNTILDFKIGGYIAWDNIKPQDGKLDESLYYDFGTGVSAHGISGWSETTYPKLQVNASLSHYADNFIQGNHEFKLGVQYTRSSSDGFYSYSGGVIYYLYYGEPYSAYFQSPYNYGTLINKIGGFVDDAWSITNRLTLNLGLRFDHQDGNIMEVPELDSQRHETGKKIPGINNVVVWNTVSPRIGLVFQLTPDKKTIFRANYGHYYDGMTQYMFYRMNKSRPPVYAYGYNPATGKYDDFWYVIDPKYSVGDDVKNSLCKQFSFGITREIIPDLALDLTFVYKYTNNFYSWWNTSAKFEEVQYWDKFAEKDITVYNQTTPKEDDILTLINPPDYKQKYRAFIIGLQKRLSHNWQMSSSFVWSKANGVSAISQLGQGTRNGIQNPNQLINNNWNSLLQGDRTYMFKLQGSYFLPYDFSISANLVAQTGKPIARMLPVTGMDQGSFSIMAEPRGANGLRLDPYYMLDFRLEKKINFSKRGGVNISADIFNVFNADTMTQTIDIGTSDRFMKPEAIVPPRRVQVSLRFFY